MFFLFARMRLCLSLCLILSFAPATYALEESLFTSSVTYCDPPESILVQQLDITYFNRNQSVAFNISAASVSSDVNVTANLLLNAYGMTPVNFTLDICSMFGGALCPLPSVNFTGADSIPLPSSLGVADRLPSLIFKIPDLEGFAQLTLVEVGTGEVKACVQATLSNGWSAHQTAVEWTTGALALLILLLAIWPSLSPDNLIPFRFLDLLHLFQTIASSALLSINYPSVYRAFALNFAWSLGLFSSSTSTIQQSINDMRARTGGDMANSTSSSAVGFVNRKLSPFNTIAVRDLANATSSSPWSLLTSPLSSTNVLATGGQAGEVQTVTSVSSNVLQAGIPIYVNSIHVSSANAFMTVFITALDLIAIAIAFFTVAFVVLRLARHRASGAKSRVQALHEVFPSFVKAWVLRLTLIVLFPILIFSFYQWTLKDSWLSVLLSVISVLSVLGAVGYPTYVIMRAARSSNTNELSSRPQPLLSYGALYARYRTGRYWFFIPSLVTLLARAMIFAFGHSNGLAQIITLLIFEGCLLASRLAMRPFQTRGEDVFSTSLSIVRFVSVGLMIAFLERLDLDAIPRVVIGCVIGVIFCVMIIVILVTVVLQIITFVRHRGDVGLPMAMSSDNVSPVHLDRPYTMKQESYNV